MSICRGIAGRRGKNPVGILFTMVQIARMQRQRIIGIIYKMQTWKMDLLIIMCAAMESYRRKMTKIVLGTAETQAET